MRDPRNLRMCFLASVLSRASRLCMPGRHAHAEDVHALLDIRCAHLGGAHSSVLSVLSKFISCRNTCICMHTHENIYIVNYVNWLR